MLTGIMPSQKLKHSSESQALLEESVTARLQLIPTGWQVATSLALRHHLMPERHCPRRCRVNKRAELGACATAALLGPHRTKRPGNLAALGAVVEVASHSLADHRMAQPKAYFRLCPSGRAALFALPNSGVFHPLLPLPCFNRNRHGFICALQRVQALAQSGSTRGRHLTPRRGTRARSPQGLHSLRRRQR